MAALVGFGAAAINPYMAFESIEDMVADRGVIADLQRTRPRPRRPRARACNYVQDGHRRGLYGAQLFQAIAQVLDEYFHRAELPGRIDLDDIADGGPAGMNWPTWTAPSAPTRSAASAPGANGEYPVNPDSAFKLQHARAGQYSVSTGGRPAASGTCRAVCTCVLLSPSTRSSPSASIVKRFSTGAMVDQPGASWPSPWRPVQLGRAADKCSTDSSPTTTTGRALHQAGGLWRVRRHAPSHLTNCTSNQDGARRKPW